MGFSNVIFTKVAFLFWITANIASAFFQSKTFFSVGQPKIKSKALEPSSNLAKFEVTKNFAASSNLAEQEGYYELGPLPQADLFKRMLELSLSSYDPQIQDPAQKIIRKQHSIEDCKKLIKNWESRKLEGEKALKIQQDKLEKTIKIFEKIAIMQVCRNGHKNILINLIKNGADINTSQGFYKKSPLMYAAENGHKELVELLIDNGADINAKTIRGKMALTFAKDKKYHQIAKTLLNPKKSFAPEAVERSYNNLDKIIREIGEKDYKYDQDCKDSIGRINVEKSQERNIKTTVDRSRMSKMLEEESLKNKTKELLKNIDQFKNTILFYASQKGEIKMLELALEYGCDIDQKTMWGESPLILAAQNGHTDAVLTLLRNGADLNNKAFFGRTALSIAKRKGYKKIVEILFDPQKTKTKFFSKLFKFVKDKFDANFSGGYDEEQFASIQYSNEQVKLMLKGLDSTVID